jgi:hypothetical protein
MKSISKAVGLVVLALGATLSHAGTAHAPATPRSASNPQPSSPLQIDSTARSAASPQLLPQRQSGAALANTKPYIGETEKNR